MSHGGVSREVKFLESLFVLFHVWSVAVGNTMDNFIYFLVSNSILLKSEKRRNPSKQGVYKRYICLGGGERTQLQKFEKIRETRTAYSSHPPGFEHKIF